MKTILKVIIVNVANQIIPAIQKMESNVTISVNQGDILLILVAKELALYSHIFHLGVEHQLENVFGLYNQM